MRGRDEGVSTSSRRTSVEGSVRRPYVAPFVRNLDVSDTEGKQSYRATEGVSIGNSGTEYPHGS
jgi:hypothetical protein